MFGEKEKRMKKEKVFQMLAVIIVVSMLVYQVVPGLQSATTVVASNGRNKGNKKQEVKSVKKIVPAVPVSAGSIIITSNATGTAVDEEHTISNKKGQIQYLVQAKSKSAYEKIENSCKGKESEETSEFSVLKEEKLLVADLSEKEAEALDEIEGVTVEVDALMDGAEIKDEEDTDKTEQELEEGIAQVSESEWSSKAIQAQGQVGGKDPVKVAVLDSGMDLYGDYEIEESINLIDAEFNPHGKDMTGHGTAVQSVIGSADNEEANTGVAASCLAMKMYSVRVLDSNNQAPISRVAEGIQWCIDNDIQIINMSFGMDNYSEVLEHLIRKAEQAGILLIASVGNTGTEAKKEVQYPAGYQEVIGVGSVNEKMERSSYSAVGNGVELMAPGENVPVSNIFSFQAVGKGTSFAAPHVTAVAALLWSHDNTRSNREIRGILQSSARYLGEKEEYGFGLVDYSYASEIMEDYELPEEDTEFGAEYLNKVSVTEYMLSEVVTASWSKADHKNILSNMSVGEFMSVLMTYSVISDGEYKTSKSSSYRILHAAGESSFVSGARALFNAAMYAKGGKRKKSDVISVIKKNNEGLSKTEVSTLEKVVDDMFVKKDTSNQTIAYRILGLSLHIAEDAYAHRVLVPTYNSLKQRLDEINGEDNSSKEMKNIFVNITELKREIAYRLKTAELRKYANTSADYIRKYFIDNKKFLKTRYTVAAKWACRRTLQLWRAEKKFDMYVFCPNLTYRNSSEFMLEGLSLNVHKIYGHYEKIPNNLAGAEMVSGKTWANLSGMK